MKKGKNKKINILKGSSDSIESQESNTPSVSTPRTYKVKKWHKWIMLFFTFIAAITPWIFHFEKVEGTFLAMLKGQEITSPVNRTMLVYMDKDSADLSKINIFPQIINPSKYSLEDFKLDFKISADSVDIYYTDYYKVRHIAEGNIVEYDDNKLDAKRELATPFVSFMVKDKGQVKIELTATYNGVDEPFKYNASIYSKKLNAEKYRLHLIFNDALRYSSNNNNCCIDLYVIEDGKIDSWENLTIDSLSKKALSFNYGRTGGVPKSKAPSQEIEITPWYMYIVGIILFLIIVAAMLVGVRLFFTQKQKRWVVYLGLLLTTFIITVSLYYIEKIHIIPLFSEMGIHINLWGGLLRIYCLPMTYYFSRWLFRNEKNGFQRGLYTGGVWVFMIGMVFALTIIYL